MISDAFAPRVSKVLNKGGKTSTPNSAMLEFGEVLTMAKNLIAPILHSLFQLFNM